MDYNGTSEPSCYFFAIFLILLDAHAAQYGINLDNNVEIQLTYRNSKSVPKFVKHLQYNLSIVYYI
jgi:hypothetical protein